MSPQIAEIESENEQDLLCGIGAEMFAAAARRRFRGSIADYARTIVLRSGYHLPSEPDSFNNVCRNCRSRRLTKCRHFEIDTCRQLEWPLKAIQDPNVRMVMILKAAQTLGSLAWDMALHWLIVHSHYTTIFIFIDSDEKAQSYCDKRLMPTLKKNPDIAKFVPEGVDRHDNQKTSILFTNGKVVHMGGLNERNCSSLSAQVVIIDEGWEHGADGLMQKAIDRAKQIADRKIIIVGQAGKVDEDQDRIWKSLHKRVPLTFACPCCGGRQEFNLTRTRPESFVSVTQATSVEQGAGSKIVPELLLPPAPKPGTHYGLRIKEHFADLDTPEKIKAAALGATYECLHCGLDIPDTKEMRAALMATYEQDYQIALPDGSRITPERYEVGFWIPDPSSVTVPFSQTMQAYIEAKKTADGDLKNKVPLEDFYKNRWATPWDENLVKVIRARAQEKYDVQSDWPEEWRGRRSLIIDCQYELQHFWGSVWAVSRSGKSRQLWRGLLRGFGDSKQAVTWKPAANETPTVVDAQKHFAVVDQFVFLDAGYMKNELVEECAKHGHWGRMDGERAWLCWTLLVGSPQKDFLHKEDQNPKIRHPVSDPFYEYPQLRVDKESVSVEVFYFSKLQMSQMFARYRDGNGPETLFLDETERPDVAGNYPPLSWTAQTNASTPHYEPNRKTGESSEIWRPDKQSTPHHYFDIGTEFMAVHCLWGISGHHQFAEPAMVDTPQAEVMAEFLQMKPNG